MAQIIPGSRDDRKSVFLSGSVQITTTATKGWKKDKRYFLASGDPREQNDTPTVECIPVRVPCTYVIQNTIKNLTNVNERRDVYVTPM